MNVRVFNGTKESYADWDFNTFKSMYGFEFGSTEEFNIYFEMCKTFRNNRAKNISDNETISRLNEVYIKTAWNHYIGDYERFTYLLNNAKNKK